MKPSRIYLSLIIYLILAFPLYSALDCYNDVAEADFLGAQKIEAIDLADFGVEKSSSSWGLVVTSFSFFPEFRFFFSLEIPSIPVPFSLIKDTILRC